MGRKEGFYWVVFYRFDGAMSEPTIAEWCGECWFVPGSDEEYSDKGVARVFDGPLTTPEGS